MDWLDLLTAFALMLVLEGLMPFLSPNGFKRRLLQVLQLKESALRLMGLGSMLLGLIVLYLVRQ